MKPADRISSTCRTIPTLLIAALLAACSFGDGGSTAATAITSAASAGESQPAATTMRDLPGTEAEAGDAYNSRTVVADTGRQTPVSYSVSGQPAWSRFDSNTGTLSGNPTSSDVGQTADITVTVNDAKQHGTVSPLRFRGWGRSGSTATKTAPTTNHAPTIAGTPLPEVIAGQAYSFAPTSSDTDGDKLSFSVQNKPTWASFNTGTGQLSGTPSVAAAGTYSNIIITASDGVAATSLPGFAISVTQSANGSALLSWSAPTQNTDGSALTDLAGYRIYYSTNSASLSQVIEIPTVGLTSYQIGGLVSGTWYFAISAYSKSGTESSASTVAAKTIG